MNSTRLNEDYSKMLQRKIPILNNDILNLLYKYCTGNSRNSINKIREELKSQFKVHNPNIKLDPWINKNNLVVNFSNNKKKFIKEHIINTDALIESIINITLYYYQKNITVNSNLEISNKKSVLLQVMNIAPGKMLGLYIIKDIYVDSNNNSNKNLQLLYILKIIAMELNNLQKSYNFVHGDFHVNNIYININNNNINIKFIDFGKSMINIPLNNNTYCLLISPAKDDDEPDLKHLIYNLDTIEKKDFNDIKNYKIYKNFVKLLKEQITYSNYNNTDNFIEKIQLLIESNIKNEIINNYKNSK